MHARELWSKKRGDGDAAAETGVGAQYNVKLSAGRGRGSEEVRLQ